jgi:hypothetical protein
MNKLWLIILQCLYILTAGGVDDTDPFTTPAEASSSDEMSSTRTVLFRFTPLSSIASRPRHETLQFVYGWNIPTPWPEAIAMQPQTNGKLSITYEYLSLTRTAGSWLLYFVNTSCRVMSQSLSLSPNNLTSASSSIILDAPEERRQLLPNPFKALKSRSYESLPLLTEKSPEVMNEGQPALGPVVDIGDIGAHGKILGAKLFSGKKCLIVVTWSDAGVIVSHPILGPRNKSIIIASRSDAATVLKLLARLECRKLGLRA